MLKANRFFSIVLLSALLLTACDTLKNLPTNTTGGLFSLNGTWRMESTTDNNGLQGTTITLYPIVGNGTIKTIENNTYCVKEGTDLWRNVKGNNKGGFVMNTLVSACNGTTITKEGEITVINPDEVTVTTRNATGTEMIQQWKRVKSK